MKAPRLTVKENLQLVADAITSTSLLSEEALDWGGQTRSAILSRLDKSLAKKVFHEDFYDLEDDKADEVMTESKRVVAHLLKNAYLKREYFVKSWYMFTEKGIKTLKGEE